MTNFGKKIAQGAKDEVLRSETSVRQDYGMELLEAPRLWVYVFRAPGIVMVIRIGQNLLFSQFPGGMVIVNGSDCPVRGEQ